MQVTFPEKRVILFLNNMGFLISGQNLIPLLKVEEVMHGAT